MITRFVLILFISVFLCLVAHSSDLKKGNSKIKIVFYNVENLFYIIDDTLKSDNEFLPNSYKKWNEERFTRKLNNIYKVIVAIGQWNAPEIIGLCEIENYYVLNSLISNTPLLKYNYSIIHYDSPDKRGIDVALLYLKNSFIPVYSEPVRINFPENSSKTRDILYVKGIINVKDTIHLFVNHWPSRWGGQSKTENKRIYVAKVLKSKTDSILNIDKNSNIIIMGDFNDEASDKSISEYLVNEGSALVSLNMTSANNNIGTLKYRGIWSVFDQFVVSGGLLNNNNTVSVLKDRVYIFSPDFLLVEDDKYTGVLPFRTYAGPKYLGGFSDHLPIVMEINLIKD